jgi:uncharacterized protein (TIGR00730 family)
MSDIESPADNEHAVEQSQESIASPVRLSRSELDGVHQTASKLIDELERIPDGDLVGEIIANALKLLRDQTNRGDIKLINKSYKELRYAMKVFAPYRDTRKVSIFGSARTPERHGNYIAAAEFARQMADSGWMVITGAGGGIMAAGHGGAGADPSFGLAIRLPFEQATNVHIANDPKLINFKYFFTRKLMFLRSSSAIVVFPGGFGTMDEAFEALTLIQTGKSVPTPVVLLNRPGGDFWNSWQAYVENHLLKDGLISPHDLHLYKITDSVEAAVHEVTHFYSNYHSARYARDEIVLRLQRCPSESAMQEINEKFKDILIKGSFRLTGPLPVEKDEPGLSNLCRLIFHFNRRDHGRLRMLINYLNDL